jgi:Bacterial extracellular solute-binding protein
VEYRASEFNHPGIRLWRWPKAHNNEKIEHTRRRSLSTSNGRGAVYGSSSASRFDLSVHHYYLSYMKQRLNRCVRALSLGFCFVPVFSLCGCSRHADRSVTITILDPEWSQPELLPVVAGNGDQKTSFPSRIRQTGETERFVRETGIRVEHSPLPETSLAQLALVQKLFREHSASPDLLGIDVIWPEIIDAYLLDLKPYFSSEISSLDPELIASFTVKGKVVSIPYHMQIGVLAYRTDLLRKYGYTRPPSTWDELERMAARIQAGERAEGKKDFWGYVWQGRRQKALLAMHWNGKFPKEEGESLKRIRPSA